MTEVHYADVARQYKLARQQGDQLMAHVRAAAKYLKDHHGYSLESFARVAGLHKNTLMKLRLKSWRPNQQTLRKLDQIIVREKAKRQGKVFEDEKPKRGRPREDDGDGHARQLSSACATVPAKRITRATRAN